MNSYVHRKYGNLRAHHVPVQVGKFFVPVDFLVVDMAEDPACPIILARPFSSTVDTNISMKKGLLSFTISDEVIEYAFNKTYGKE